MLLYGDSFVFCKGWKEMQIPEKNLGFELLRVTESAALAAARWLGKGNKEQGDGAAVDAMRLSFNSLSIKGQIIIGEGAKDKAPMLYNGECVGDGTGPSIDIAVDPIEGTNLLALGRPNAIAVIGACKAGYMFRPGSSYYMKKLVVGREARDAVDIDAPVADNLHAVARALGKDINDLVVFVLDKPRHRGLVEEIRKTGARITLHSDGDVAGSLMVVDQSSEVDVMMGTGGTPEGVISACAIKGMGGQIFGRFDPQSEEERNAMIAEGTRLDEILTVDSIIRSEDAFFAATGISGGGFLAGVNFSGKGAVTHSLVIRAKTGTFRYLESHHNWERLMKFSSVRYD